MVQIAGVFAARTLECVPMGQALQVESSVAPKAVLNVPLMHAAHPPIEPVNELVPFLIER